MNDELDSVEYDGDRELIKFNVGGTVYYARPTLNNDAYLVYNAVLGKLRYNKADALDYLRKHTTVMKMESRVNSFFSDLFEDGLDRDLSTPYKSPPASPIVNGPASAVAPQSVLQGPTRPIHEDDSDYKSYNDYDAWVQDVSTNYPSAAQIQDPNTGVTTVTDPHSSKIIGSWDGISHTGRLRTPGEIQIPDIVKPSHIGTDAQGNVMKQEPTGLSHKQPQLASISWNDITKRFGSGKTSYIIAETLRRIQSGVPANTAFGSATAFYGKITDNKEWKKASEFIKEALNTGSMSMLGGSSLTSPDTSDQMAPEEMTPEEWFNKILDNPDYTSIQRPEQDDDSNLMYATDKQGKKVVFVKNDGTSKGLAVSNVESVQRVVKSEISNKIANLLKV